MNDQTRPPAAERDIPQRTIPALPAELGGQPVEWGRWEAAPVMSHIDPACRQCAHPGPAVCTIGRVFSEKCHANRRGPGGPLARRLLRLVFAVRCPACQEMRITERAPYGTTGRVEVAYWPPRAGGAAT